MEILRESLTKKSGLERGVVVSWFTDMEILRESLTQKKKSWS